MKTRYNLEFKKGFLKTYKKLIKGNSRLEKEFSKTFKKLKREPHYPSLKTHKVDTKKYEDVYSSSVTGDVRVIWEFDKDKNLVILVLETGTHSGVNQVYINKSF